MAFPKLEEAQGKLSEARKALHEVFEQAGDDMDMAKVTVIDGDSKAKVDWIRTKNTEIDDLAGQVEEYLMLEAAARKAKDPGSGAEGGDGGAPTDGRTRIKSIGELFVESEAFTKFDGKQSPAVSLDIDLKTLFDTGTSWTPETTRGPRIVLDEQRPIQVADLIPQTTTTQTAITYMEETTFTNAAAETAEGASKPEAALALTERTSNVRKIPVWLPVTTETFEDLPRARAYVNNRLPFMVRQRLDTQIISGNGTAPNLRGILNVSGIQTQAKGADPTPDAVYKAMTKVEVTGQAMPDAAVFHPNDWQEIRLLRTADGIYIWGNPSEAGPERIWGLRAVKVQAATEGTGVVGDFRNFSELAVKKDIEIRVSDSHSTYFVENKVAVLAEMRAALVWYRPSAFCTVTGI